MPLFLLIPEPIPKYEADTNHTHHLRKQLPEQHFVDKEDSAHSYTDKHNQEDHPATPLTKLP
jgi:hypothetical protein